MCNISADQVNQILFSEIDSLLEQRELFLTNPKSDFTRTKKLSFEQTILFPMVAASGDIANELLDYIGEENLPLPSAMVQRHNQVKPEAFIELFKSFTSHVPLRKGINQVHLNALYDVLNDVFIDAQIQSVHTMDEKRAFCHFLDKYADLDVKRIYIADRGYASYNVFAHAIHNRQLFLIRTSESYAKGICADDPTWLLGEQFDKEISINIGRRRSQKNRPRDSLQPVKRTVPSFH